MFIYYPILVDEAEFYGPTYIQCCEYFQMDPRINYTFEQFNKRYEEIVDKVRINPGILSEKSLKEIHKGLIWIKKRKEKLPLIVNYTTKMILQRKLIIPDGMIHETFTTAKGLTKEALKYYYTYVLGEMLFLILFLSIFFVIFFLILR